MARASGTSSRGVAIESFQRLNTPNMHTTPRISTIWASSQCSARAAYDSSVTALGTEAASIAKSSATRSASENNGLVEYS